MGRVIRGCGVCAGVVSGLMALAGCVSNSPAVGQHGMRAQLPAARAAFFDAWTKREGKVFDAMALSKRVANGPDFLSFDGMSHDVTVIEGSTRYLDIWTPAMNGFVSASLREQEVLREWQSGDQAVTASIVRVQGVMPDGKSMDMPGHMTLVWQWTDGMGWRVVHEHMSLGVKR